VTEEVAEHDIHWARREVVRNCIYGVDLNPMAVELAKLSLWLTTVASNRPLSFLDHHLRCGNSLVGAELDALVALPSNGHEGQSPLWSFVVKNHTEALIRQYGEIAALPDDDLEAVKWKEARLREIENSELNRRLKEVANLWISTYFGNVVPDDDYAELQNRLSTEKYPDWSEFRTQDWFKHAQETGAGRRFFHWELEFPEVFFDVGGKKENPGWDAVVGNPPWVTVKAIDEASKKYYRGAYETARGKFDIYSLFIDRGLSLLLQDAYLGFIVSNKFLRTNYGKPLRELIINKGSIKTLIDYADLPLFGDATNYSLVLILKNKIPSDEHMCDAIAFKDNLRCMGLLDVNNIVTSFESSEFARKSRVKQELFRRNDNWDLTSIDNVDIIKKINDVSSPLSFFSSSICQGVWTGKKDVFVDHITQQLIDDGKIELEIVLPVIDGCDIERYFFDYESRKYIFYPYRIYNGQLKLLDIDDYPKAKEYLEPHRSELEQRRNWGQSILEAGKKYYEIWNPSPHLQKKKILTQDISNKNKFVLDSVGGHLAMNTCYALILREEILESHEYILVLLNAKLLNFIFATISPKLQGCFFRYKTQYIEKLPIRRISFTPPEPERAAQVSELKDLYATGNFEEILARAEACLPKDAEGNFVAEGEKSDVVHDLLAFLAEQMMDLNKQKHSEIKSFLRWLEEETGAKVDALTNKTKIRAYYELDVSELLAILKKNKRKLSADPAKRKFQDDLRQEFTDSMATLGPLLARIEETDRLIDQIVYKLYGLNDEEIGIVEQATG